MKDKIQSFEEIKQIERELYLKKSKLAGEEAMDYQISVLSSHIRPKDSSPEEWKKAISELIRIVGLQSKGGNSVEDVRKERRK